jgi:hypothetical protein
LDETTNVLKDKEGVSNARKEFDVGVNAENTICVFVSCRQNAGQNYNLNVANKPLEGKVR